MELIIKTPEEEFLKVVEFNFDELKTELTASLAKYQGLTYDESQIKEAKSDRATLNKFKDAIETKRKDIKKRCLLPYEVFEKKIKELTSLVDKPILAIDSQVKTFENKKKEEKKAELTAFFENSVNSPAKKYITFENVFNERMLNASLSLQMAKQELLANIEKIERDITAIDSMENYATEALAAYLKTFSLADALEEAKRLKRIAEIKAEQEKQPAPAPKEEEPKQPIEPTKEEPKPAQPELLTACFKVTASREQLLKLRDFIRANGIKIDPIIGIKEDDLSEFIGDSLFLRNLYKVGVDNWQDFEEAKHPTDAEISEKMNEYKL